MTGPVTCCVPFCSRLRGKRKREKPSHDEHWVCATHWAAVPAGLKRRKQLHEKFVKREIARRPLMARWWKLPPGSPERIKAIRMFGLSTTLSRRCARAAIEAAGGI